MKILITLNIFPILFIKNRIQILEYIYGIKNIFNIK